MRSMSPWRMGTECPDPKFSEFKAALNDASYYHAGPTSEWKHARTHIEGAAQIAIKAEWPYWAMNRMFREIGPLVDWDQFMQTYINTLTAQTQGEVQ
jgi:hypothetical protein